MCELRCDFHPTVATRSDWSLPLQRMRPILQDEWDEPAAGQASTSIGKQGAIHFNRSRLDHSFGSGFDATFGRFCNGLDRTKQTN